MKIKEWWRRLRCKHRWIPIYYGKIQVLRRCMFCYKEKWFKT